ncbi:MAG: hypothetical protein LBU61_00835, partial [Coriobacteriales bacterium]|nr:hypothetical protein [Coriobacteriales bacterium]
IIDQIPNHMQNNLTDAAIRLVPELADTIDQLQDIPGIRKAQLTGSGTVVFGLAESREAAHRAASQFSAQGYWTSVCKTLPA